MTKTHEFNKALKAKVKAAGYKHCSITDQDGATRIPYNVKEESLEEKFKEIENRLPMLPDGFYYLNCKYRQGSKEKADTFTIKKGNPNQLSEAPQPAPVYLPMKKTTADESDKARTYSEALEDQKKISKLEIENELLKQKVSDLEAELETMEEEGLSDQEPKANPLQTWLSEIVPTVAPILDQYFQTKNRELDLREKQYQAPSPRTIQRKVKPVKPKRMWPNVNDPEAMEEFLSEVETLTEEQFNQVLEITAIEAPELHQVILSEFVEEEEESEQVYEGPEEGQEDND